MKTRIGSIILLLGVSLLYSVELVQAQKAPVASSTAAETRSSQPTAPSAPNVPTAPSVPTVPTVPPVPDMDPLGDVMFPPDLIMRHARELGLTDEQKSFMRGEIQRTTTQFIDLQWQLQDAMEALHQTLEGNTVNEQQALAHLDKVLDTEREIKHLHVGLGIRIKNHLTPEQQAMLQRMRIAASPDGQPTPRPTE